MRPKTTASLSSVFPALQLFIRGTHTACAVVGKASTPVQSRQACRDHINGAATGAALTNASIERIWTSGFSLGATFEDESPASAAAMPARAWCGISGNWAALMQKH
jgi:hypothetical protein